MRRVLLTGLLLTACSSPVQPASTPAKTTVTGPVGTAPTSITLKVAAQTVAKIGEKLTLVTEVTGGTNKKLRWTFRNTFDGSEGRQLLEDTVTTTTKSCLAVQAVSELNPKIQSNKIEISVDYGCSWDIKPSPIPDFTPTPEPTPNPTPNPTPYLNTTWALSLWVGLKHTCGTITFNEASQDGLTYYARAPRFNACDSSGFVTLNDDPTITLNVANGRAEISINMIWLAADNQCRFFTGQDSDGASIDTNGNPFLIYGSGRVGPKDGQGICSSNNPWFSITRTSTASPVPTPDPTPTGPAYISGVTCGSFSRWSAAQTYYLAWRSTQAAAQALDRDNDGIACESLPGAP